MRSFVNRGSHCFISLSFRKFHTRNYYRFPKMTTFSGVIQRLNTLIGDLQTRLGEKCTAEQVSPNSNQPHPLTLALQRVDNIITALQTEIDCLAAANTHQPSSLTNTCTGTTAIQSTQRHFRNLELFSKAKLQVCKILNAVDHPKANKLLVCKVQVDNARPVPKVITICAGIKKHYNPDTLTGQLIVAVLNLPHKQMLGVSSQGMLLAGSNIDKTVIELIEPPSTCEPGDSVLLEGVKSPPSTQQPAQISLEEWTQIAALLYVKNGKATYDGIELVTEKGPITVSGLPEGAKIS
jgi:methionine--tRNA ligase beta chain